MGEDEDEDGLEHEREGGPWLLTAGGYSRWDGDTGLESESHSGSDADRLVLSLLGGAILTLTVGRHQSLWRRQAGLTGWPIHSCKLNSADHESVSPLT